MQILYTFDSRPALAGLDIGWYNAHMMMRSILLSVDASRRYGPVTFYCDECVSSLLKILGVDVSVELCEFDSPLPMYDLCKLETYEKQTEPFMHVDFDSFTLDVHEFMKDPVVVPCAVPLTGADVFSKALAHAQIDKEVDFAFNMGLYICNDLEFNREFVAEAWDLADAVSECRNLSLVNPLVDEYTAAVVAKELGTDARYIHPSVFHRVWNDHYVHLAGAEKRSYSNSIVVSNLTRHLDSGRLSEAVQFWNSEKKGK